jgi:rhomboid protease GluP
MLAAPPEMRMDFERGMSRWPRATCVLIGVNALVFAWELASGALSSSAAIVQAGALERSAVLGGQYWRLISCMFLHGGFEHLLGNCIALYIVGMACEHAVGTSGLLMTYFVSGLCGSLLSVTMSPGPSVGASGAIFGVWGAVIVFLYRHHKRFYIRDKRIGLVLLIWALYTIITGWLSPNIDNFAHLGGLAGGALLVLALPVRLKERLPVAHASG